MIKKDIRIIPHEKYEEYFVTLNWKNLKKKYLMKILDELRSKRVNIISITYTGNLKKFGAVSGLFSAYPTIALGDSPLERETGEGRNLYLWDPGQREFGQNT